MARDHAMGGTGCLLSPSGKCNWGGGDIGMCGMGRGYWYRTMQCGMGRGYWYRTMQCGMGRGYWYRTVQCGMGRGYWYRTV